MTEDSKNQAQEKKEEEKEQPKEGTVVSNNDSKLKAAIACIPIVGLILFFIEKEDKRVRFYSAQGIIIGIVSIVLGFIPIINLFVWIITLVAIIVVAMKAYQTDEYYKLPILGDWAEQLAGSSV